MALRLHSRRGRIALVEIKLHRAEGRPEETIQAVALSYAEANDLLKTWALTAPSKGRGYHKVDVEVLWADGMTFDGTYSLQRGDARKAKIVQNWIRNHFALIGGLWKPPHMSNEQYVAARSRFSPKEQVLAAAALDEYEL